MLDAPAPTGLQILPVPGLPDFRPGDDLAGAIEAAAPWLADGDVLIVTSKVVSKVEGRLVPAPDNPDERDALRRKLIDEHTVRLVAQVGRTKIVENELGLVAAAAGIDASNVRRDEIALLPTDPDASAALLVRHFAGRGKRIGAIITDTQGRAWRDGVTDVAIGAAGVTVLDDHRGGVDEFGNQLAVTQVAVGDELAAAADLVKGKLSGVPVAVARGLAPGTVFGEAPSSAPATGRSLIRRREEDLFRLGTDLALAQGRAEGALFVQQAAAFTGEAVDDEVVRAAIATATAAPGPGGHPAVSFVVVREHLDALLQATAGSYEADLAEDGLTAAQIAERVGGAELPPGSAVVLLACSSASALRDHPDGRRQAAEQQRLTAAGGAALHSLLVALAARDIGTWVSAAPLFCPALVRSVLELPGSYRPLALVALGHPVRPLQPRQPHQVQVLYR